MKREQIINKIYDKIRDDLLHALLPYWEEDDANKYPLVVHLSSGNDISTGRDEIDNLIEQIEIEPLIDEILALPLDVPIGLDCEIWRQKDRQYLIDKEVFTQGELDQRLLGRWEGLTWMKDEIINLNDTK